MEFAVQVAGQTHHDKSGIEAIVEEAVMAERLGFTTVLVPDHYVFEQLGNFQKEEPAYELFFVMATLAQRTTRVRIGSQVACVLFRHPAMLARLFAQVDEASDGRVIAGVGAGWTRAEFEMLGLDFPDVSERLKILDEAVAVMRGLWGEDPFSFEGRYFHLSDAMARPRPRQEGGPPIMLGGSGAGILRRAGQWADIIHLAPSIGKAGTTTIESVRAFTDQVVDAKLERVRHEAEQAGRGADAVRYATTIYNYAPTSSTRQTKEVAERVGAMFGLGPEDFLHHPVVLAGTPEEMAEEIERRVEAHGLSLMGINFASEEQIQAFADEVLVRVAG